MKFSHLEYPFNSTHFISPFISSTPKLASSIPGSLPLVIYTWYPRFHWVNLWHLPTDYTSTFRNINHEWFFLSLCRTGKQEQSLNIFVFISLENELRWNIGANRPDQQVISRVSPCLHFRYKAKSPNPERKLQNNKKKKTKYRRWFKFPILWHLEGTSAVIKMSRSKKKKLPSKKRDRDRERRRWRTNKEIIDRMDDTNLRIDDTNLRTFLIALLTFKCSPVSYCLFWCSSLLKCNRLIFGLLRSNYCHHLSQGWMSAYVA